MKINCKGNKSLYTLQWKTEKGLVHPKILSLISNATAMFPGPET